MNSPQKHAADRSSIATLAADDQFFFPEGLLGFSSHQNFTLSPYQPGDGNESPFFLLQAKDDDLCFPLVSPHLVVSDYQLQPAPELLAKLGAGSATDLTVMVTVTIRDRLEEVTVNLQGPILLNPVSHLGLQFVIEPYPVRYPLINPRQI
ncbi:MAG TPA: flagellar assembly protein FliW [Candidatus Binatia bacterium]